MSATLAITIRVPSPLREHCQGASKLEVPAASVRAALDEIERRYPALHACICEDHGAPRRHLNLFINTTNLRDIGGLDTALAPGDELTILPAVSGG